jgi:hypothetical protein
MQLAIRRDFVLLRRCFHEWSVLQKARGAHRIRVQRLAGAAWHHPEGVPIGDISYFKLISHAPAGTSFPSAW